MRIVDLHYLRKVSGDVGFEIEIEGVGLTEAPPDPWLYTRDGSLKGPSAEYVLKSPVDIEELDTALRALFLSNDGAGYKISPRCGIHVHINCQEEELMDVLKYIILYYVMEELIMNSMCAEFRRGNLFCLRAVDCDAIPYNLAECIAQGDLRGMMSENFRYAALNITSLAKYGSLEFRAKETTLNINEILTWVKILLRIKEAAKEFERFQDIVEAVSADGLAFGWRVFGDLWPYVDCEDAERMILEGAQMMQDSAYQRWGVSIPADHVFIIENPLWWVPRFDNMYEPPMVEEPEL